MPAFAHMPTFMQHVRRANSHFEKWKNSSLHDLLGVLRADNCSVVRIKAELRKIPTGKVEKYADAMHFLIASLPGLSYHDVPWGVRAKSRAALFPRAQMPAEYDPTSTDKAKRIVKGAPPTAFSWDSCEEFLLSSTENNGVIVIHLDGGPQEMNNVYDGKTALSHVNSVLRVAGMVGAKAMALHFQPGKPICDEMQKAWSSIADRDSVHESGKYHMGGRYHKFCDFAYSLDNVVLMGHDATICVHANFFGANEPSADGGGLATPLRTMVNVVTSRAVLLSYGDLYPKDWQKEYGVLEGT